MLNQEVQLKSVFNSVPASGVDAKRHSVRRPAPHKEAEFSSQSIMNVMEKFVDAVQEMDQTILVPSRLMDLKVGDESEPPIAGKTKDISSDLYCLHSMIRRVKNELLWGAENNNPLEDLNEEQQQPLSTSTSTAELSPCSNSSLAGSTVSTMSGSSSSTAVKSKPGHVRRPSDTSVASNQSVVSLSDTDSEASAENDSGVEGETETAKPDYTMTVENSFRRHLYGLHRSLRQMTAAACYITKRYQDDIGAGV